MAFWMCYQGCSSLIAVVLLSRLKLDMSIVVAQIVSLLIHACNVLMRLAQTSRELVAVSSSR